MRQSKRGQVEAFIVMDVMEAARRAEAEGRHIIHMEVGQPATGAPAAARAALQARLDRPLGYTVALGLPELRAGIAALYDRWYGVDLDPTRVVVTAGASGAFTLAFAALFDAGDRVAMGDPGYPSYRQILRAMSLSPVAIPTLPEHRYQPCPQEIPADVQGLMLASPGNPSGTMLGPQAFRTLLDRAAELGVSVISDEIYHGLSYGERCHSALEFSDDVYVVNSFSKYFSMTGWRIGWMVVPEAHIRTVERLAQNMFICPPHASQIAALGALDAMEECEGFRAVYAENRRRLMDALPKIGFDRIAPPDGAFYVYADVSAMTDDSLRFCGEILERAGVAVTPGLDFDPMRGRRTIRLSYAGSTDDIAEGIARLSSFMASR
ncbi:pyridoxal phosphate-dependent aminotransferase [Paracoccus isoporae]|nr:aminotransferase class I/II-fold pyridoxal phosphate-dependent enzyme [Paracoccus isoporae]